jgi:hypothetical protein
MSFRILLASALLAAGEALVEIPGELYRRIGLDR